MEKIPYPSPDTPEALLEFAAKVKEAIPGATVDFVPVPKIGDPYAIVHLPGTNFPALTFPLCVGRGEAVQVLDNGDVLVVIW